MRVLDVGSGSDSITVGLAEQLAPGKVTGIDIQESPISIAEELASSEGQRNVNHVLHKKLACQKSKYFPAELRLGAIIKG
jgi:ubiquinone/menaquinone biosynthesis C-methylase UbiE